MNFNKSFFVVSMGNVMEWYDFSLYAYFATMIAHQFFPSDNHMLSLILTFAIFAIGFLSRPLGSLFFGYIGDKYGTVTALKLSLYLIVLPTVLMACLPTYHQVGLLAPILLLCLRLLQGFSVGGQYTGTIIYTAENAATSERAFVTSFSLVSAVIGFLMGSLIAFILLHLFPVRWHLDSVWRVAYLLSLFLFAYVYINRSYLVESESQSETSESISPLRDIFSNHCPLMLKAILFMNVSNVNFYILLTFFVTFMHSFAHLSLTTALLINTFTLILACVAIPCFAKLSDNIGRKPVMISACVGLILLSFPLLKLTLIGNPWITFFALSVLVICLSAYCGPASSLYTELFPKAIRFSGLSFSYNVSASLFGGTAPVVCLSLIHYFQSPLVIGFYIIFYALIGVGAFLFTEETYKIKIN